MGYENGPDYGDEINLVEPGFNSGWKKIHGIWYVSGTLAKSGIASAAPKDLVDFVNRGTYSFSRTYLGPFDSPNDSKIS